MKHTIQTTTEVGAQFSFEGGYEEIFVRPHHPEGPSFARHSHISIDQNGHRIFVPASDFRAFLKALSEWADEAGIPA